MHLPRLTHRFSGSLALAALTSGLLLSPPAAQAQQVPGSGTALSRASATNSSPAAVAVPQHREPHGVRTVRHPLMLKVRGHDANGRPLVAAGAPGGYTAAQLRASTGLQGTGKGQTVAIVDAFDDPYAAQDLNAYSAQMGLFPICKHKHTKKNCFTFERLHPDGIGGLDRGWAIETSLDIEMVHAMAPEANIVLVEAVDATVEAMFSAVDYAASLHPAVISNSWGANGEDPTESTLDQHCQLTDGICVFSTGDAGFPGGYPAYNPHVLAVGGTSLRLDRSGTVLTEAAWDLGGGGVSQFEPRPTYQPEALNSSPGRGIPDVSFDADPLTGAAVYSTALTGWLTVGGTSVGAPAWAGILAAADQLRAAAGKPVLTAAGDEAQNAVYQLPAGLADITEGSNGSCGAVCTAGPGYDFVTGLGSPRPGIDTGLASAP